MHLNKNHTFSRRALAMLLTLTLCLSLVPSAFAAQQNSYHDPAEHWMQASNRTNELDVNSVVTRETFKCGECGKVTSFEVFRVPEYTRNGQTALSRNVKYSDGTMMDGVGKGDCMDGVPGKDAYYTGYHLETVSGGEDEGDTVILRITVTVKDHLQMADEYRFNADQRKLLEELMQPEYQELFAALTGSYQDIELSPDEVAKIMENLPADLSEARREVVLTAYQLLGRVHYFWGGKSLVIGWDSRWGMPMEVTAEGSSTTGTVRPFGLDCSGMVDWVFYNQSGGQYVIGHGGGATAQHSYCAPIAWGDAQPGDLVFYPGDSHVGIVCGFDSSGNIMVIHCASSENNVVVTGKSGFTSIGRPEYFAD